MFMRKFVCACDTHDPTNPHAGYMSIKKAGITPGLFAARRSAYFVADTPVWMMFSANFLNSSAVIRRL